MSPAASDDKRHVGARATRIDTPLRRAPVEISVGNLSPACRARILARDGYACRYPGCGSTTGLQVDHIVARGLGGRDTDDNLETLCATHHRQKTRQDAKLIAKAKRAGAKHRGEFPASRAKLRSRRFRPTRDWTDE